MLYRETFSLSIPRRIAEARLRERFGPPTSSGSPLRWEFGRTGPYRLAAELDGERFAVTVTTPLPYASLVVAVAGLVVAVALWELPVLAIAAIGAVSLVFALLPILPGSPWLDVGVPLPVEAEFEGRTLTPYGLVPVLGTVVCSLSILDGVLTRSIVGVATAFAAVGYLLHTGLLSHPRSQTPLFVMPLVAVTPVVLAAANLAGLHELLPLVSRTAVPLLLACFAANTVLMLAAFHVACDRGRHVVRRLPNAPLDSPGLRWAWGAVVLAVNGGFLLFSLVVGAATAGILDVPVLALPLREMVAAFAAVGAPAPAIWVGVWTVVLVSPLLALFGFWAYHVARTVTGRRRIFDATDPSEVQAVDYPIRLLDADVPNAFAVSTFTGGDRAIVVTTGLRDALGDDEFAAVVAHEAYHLDHRDPLRNAAAALFGMGIGGKNALVALFDYPAIERDADRYAARVTSVPTVARALRQLDAHTVAIAPGEATNPWTGPAFAVDPGPRRSTWRRLCLAPLDLLFGNVLLDAAHATVDERISAVSGE